MHVHHRTWSLLVVLPLALYCSVEKCLLGTGFTYFDPHGTIWLWPSQRLNQPKVPSVSRPRKRKRSLNCLRRVFGLQM